MRCAITTLLTLFLIGPPARAEELKAGLAAIDITPPKGHPMYNGTSTGTHDPLKAKAVVFLQGNEAAALVFCDLISTEPDVTGPARQAAADKTGIPAGHIAVLATHTHNSPVNYSGKRRLPFGKSDDKQPPDTDEVRNYGKTLVEKLAKVVADAKAAARPVRLEAGSAAQGPQLSFNRRFHMKDGSVQFNPGFQNPNIVRAAGPIDPEVGILLLRDGKKPAGALTSFAMHAATGGDAPRTEFSADYPGRLAHYLTKEFGDDFVSLFGAGTCGDVNHFDVRHPRDKGGARKCDEIGELLAKTVVAAVPKLRPVEPSLAVKGDKVMVPLRRYNADEVAVAEKTAERVRAGADIPFLDRVRANVVLETKRRGVDKLPCEVRAFRLGKDVALVTLPGEVFVELGLAVKQASPFQTTFVMTLANDTPNYVPTRKAFTEGSYETVNSLVEPGGGELLVEAAGRLLKELAK